MKVNGSEFNDVLFLQILDETIRSTNLDVNEIDSWDFTGQEAVRSLLQAGGKKVDVRGLSDTPQFMMPAPGDVLPWFPVITACVNVVFLVIKKVQGISAPAPVTSTTPTKEEVKGMLVEELRKANVPATTSQAVSDQMAEGIVQAVR
jgi:hypothetical protein